MRRIENKLTREQLRSIGERIILRFWDACAGGTQYGLDWPTMRVLFPRECRVFDRLRQAFKATHRDARD